MAIVYRELPEYRSKYWRAREQGYSRQSAKQLTRVQMFQERGRAPRRLRQIGPTPAAPDARGLDRFFNISGSLHLREALLPAGALAVSSLRESTGIGFFQGSYHRLTATRYAKGSYLQRYHQLMARGHTSASARQVIQAGMIKKYGRTPVNVRSPGPAGLTNKYRGGWLVGGLGLATNTAYATSHPFGPLYGFGVGAASFAIAGGGGRLGWGVGAAAGRATAGKFLGRFLGGSRMVAGAARVMLGVGTVGGAIIGGVTGAILAPLAFEYASTHIPRLGHRLSRKGFGRLYGPYQDTRQFATMRQAALAAISQSHLNARNALGGEAALLHLT